MPSEGSGLAVTVIDWSRPGSWQPPGRRRKTLRAPAWTYPWTHPESQLTGSQLPLSVATPPAPTERTGSPRRPRTPITAATATTATATITSGTPHTGRRRGGAGAGATALLGTARYGTPFPYARGVATSPIAFVTDYGSHDTYAAALHAAVWAVDPSLLALTGMHGVLPGDVLGGAYHVKAMAAAMPPGAVVCAVVDPGVGTARAAIAAQLGGRTFVLPDNGLISYVWDESPPLSRQCVALPVPETASPTFHGRDVFAPAAARLAGGASLRDLGEPVKPQLHPHAFARVEDDEAVGVVAVVDRFGNAVSTVRARDVDGRRVAAVEWEGGRSVLVVRTYADIPDGALGVLLGSAGHWEVSAREAPAEDLGGPPRGTEIRMHLA